MERRLLTFLIASTAFFLIYIGLRVMFGVQPPPPEAGDQAAAVQEDQAEADADAEDAVAAGEDNAGEPATDAGPDLAADRPDDAAEDDGAGKRPGRPEWLTLGSMDPASGYYMLVTLNSRGAGIERIELTRRDDNGRLKYRRVDVRTGYLGYLAGEPALRQDGVRVNAVGPGTPASLAQADGVPPGLRPGDVIVAIDGQVVTTPDEINGALGETEPGDEITVEVIRGAGPGRAASGEPEAAGASAGAESTALTDAANEAGGTPDEDSPADGASRGGGPEDDGSRDREGGSGVTVPGGEPILFTVQLTEHPLDLMRLAETGGADQVLGNNSRLASLMTLSRVNRKGIPAGGRSIAGLADPTELVWGAETTGDEASERAEFQLQLTDREMAAVGGEAVGLRRSYTLQPGGYVLDLGLQIDNLGENSQELAYRLEGLNGVTLEGWWYSNKISPNWGGAAARDIVYKTGAAGHLLVSGYTLLKEAKKEQETVPHNIFASDAEPPARDLSYIGVDAQYFTAAYLPPEGSPTVTNIRRASAGVVADPRLIPNNKERAVNITYYLDSNIVEVPPEQSLRQEFRLFAGPKVPEVLDQYGLGECVYYGWFSGPAKVLAWLLHLLYGIVANYGVAIVLLTVLVRGAMFPLSRKAAVNAQKMQELAPELKKIGEKYKDDLEGRMKAQRELQQRVGFNPMAGCLPMVLQLPIFIGLYRALSVDIELRQAAISEQMSWASNLAGPDMLAYWGDWLWAYLSGRGTGWLGPYFNILPVIVVGLFLAQQKLFMPPATDEQTAMTQKVMTYMTLLMGLFFFRVPAGLCIYFITSSLWGICERILVKKTLPQGKHFDAAVLEGGSGSATAKSSASLAERLRQQVSPTQPPTQPPSKRKRPATGKKKR